MKVLLISLFILSSVTAYTQEKKVFIYRIRSANGSAIKFHLKVNSTLVDFKNDTQQEFIINADSISIEVLNKRFINKTVSINQEAENENYFIVYPKEVKLGFNGTNIIVQNVCKECYYEYLSYSKRISK